MHAHIIACTLAHIHEHEHIHTFIHTTPSVPWLIVSSCANHAGWQVRATTATAIRNGNANQPPASAPITPTAASETSAVPVGSTCTLCGKQFKSKLTDINLRQHQESSACKPIASQSSQAGLVTGVPDTPIPLQSSMPLASADNFEEELRAADAKASKKRLQKQAEKGRKQERDRMAKEAKQLTAEAERADLEVAREARLDDLRKRAEHDPSLLEAN